MESYENRVCPACDRGEKSIKPPYSSIVGNGAVHMPSGNICIADMSQSQYALYVKVCELRAARSSTEGAAQREK